jgi:hypothetical protein
VTADRQRFGEPKETVRQAISDGTTGAWFAPHVKINLAEPRVVQQHGMADDTASGVQWCCYLSSRGSFSVGIGL